MHASVRRMMIRGVMATQGVAIPRDADGFTNVLLLGVGDAHHDGPDLTDTMIVASFDEVTNSAVLLSLPRDLLIDAQGRTVGGRINAIYANEKRRLEYREDVPPEEASIQALRTLSAQIGDKIGIDIHGVIKADFTAFTEAVDALGGITIDVPADITDYTYPLAEGQVGVFHVDKGPQHFDGETALKYARSRHSTSDFDRSARQQLILSALGETFKSFSLTERIRVLLAMYRSLQSHVVTTFSAGELLLVAQMAESLRRENIVMMQLNFYVGGDASEARAGGFVVPAPLELYDGASVMLPLGYPNGLYDWNQIRTFAGFIFRKRMLYVERPQISIRSVGASALQTWRLRNELLRYGFVASDIDDSFTGTGSVSYSSVYYREQNALPTASFFGDLLSLPVAHLAGADTGSGDILLVLGKDFSYTNFLTLSGAVLHSQ